MPTIKYQVKENNTIGTHSFYAQAVSYSTLDISDLAPAVAENIGISPSTVKMVLERYAVVAERSIMRGHRVKLGDLLTLYPQISVSVKDELDEKGKVTANQASSSIVVIDANTTLSASHLGKFLNASSASAITITIPNSSGIPVGAEVEIYHHGSGAVYVQSDSSTYFSFDGKSTASRKLTVPRFGVIGMKKVTAATWAVSGEATG